MHVNLVNLPKRDEKKGESDLVLSLLDPVSASFNEVPLAHDRKEHVWPGTKLTVALVSLHTYVAEGPWALGSKEKEGKKREKGARARRGTLFIQEASAAAISHRLDSDRFEPLYAYRSSETMPQ